MKIESLQIESLQDSGNNIMHQTSVIEILIVQGVLKRSTQNFLINQNYTANQRHFKCSR